MRTTCIKKPAVIIFILLSLLLIPACGGGGDSGTPPAQTTVSGLVEAPSGFIAANEKNTLFKRLSSLIASVAHASVSGLSTVADGVNVELVRINDSGAVDTVLATDTTSAGEYSFDLTALGLDYASNMLVIASAQGQQMRAFVTSDRVNINPSSEASVRLIVELLAATSGSQLQNFTPKEINRLVSSIDQLTSARSSMAATDIETTTLNIINMVQQDTATTSYLAAAAETGETSTGPGDVANFFPLDLQNTWNYRVDSSEQNEPYYSAVTVTGTKTIDNVLTRVLTSLNADNTGASNEEYLNKDSNGIRNYGNNDATDFISPQIVPYLQTTFAFETGSSFEAINQSGLVWQEDVDGDGAN